MLLLDRPSSPWTVALLFLSPLKTAFFSFRSRPRARAKLSVPRLSASWLREHELEAPKRRAE